jgi:hypothetical protein
MRFDEFWFALVICCLIMRSFVLSCAVLLYCVVLPALHPVALCWELFDCVAFSRVVLCFLCCFMACFTHLRCLLLYCAAPGCVVLSFDLIWIHLIWFNLAWSDLNWIELIWYHLIWNELPLNNRGFRTFKGTEVRCPASRFIPWPWSQTSWRTRDFADNIHSELLVRILPGWLHIPRDNWHLRQWRQCWQKVGWSVDDDNHIRWLDNLQIRLNPVRRLLGVV